MGNLKNNERLLDGVKRSIDILILLELCKLGAGRSEIREILGSLDNNLLSKINAVIKNKNHG